MTLIVENGTGLADAESFASVAELDAYLEARGIADTADDDAKEVALRVASEYADTVHRYKGTSLKASQALMFPRANLTDWSSHAITGVPSRLKQAVLYLTTQILAGEALYENITGPEVASESVGPISVSYVAGSNRHRAFTSFERLVAQYIRDPSRPRPALGWTPPADAKTFSTGMHDLEALPLNEVE